MKKTTLFALVIIALTGCDLIPVGPDSEEEASIDLKTLAINDGVGVGDFLIANGTIEEMTDIYGVAKLITTNEQFNSKPLVYHYADLGIVFRKGSKDSIYNWYGIIFQDPYQGKTKRGIRSGDSRNKVLSTYGNGDNLSNIENFDILINITLGLELGSVQKGALVSYKKTGILFVFDSAFGGNVDLIAIFDPRVD